MIDLVKIFRHNNMVKHRFLIVLLRFSLVKYNHIVDTIDKIANHQQWIVWQLEQRKRQQK